MKVGQTVATGGGRYIVYVDDVEYSSHTQQHTYHDALRQAQVDNPDSVVEGNAEFPLRYEPSDDELEGLATDPVDEPEEPDDPDDGADEGDDPDEPAPDPDAGEVIPHDQNKLTAYSDPTESDQYKEYPEAEPKSHNLDNDLASIATAMEPGEWQGLGGAPYTVHGKWTDKAMWDPQRQRVSYVAHHTPGGERPTRWAMWDFSEGLWYKQSGDKFHPKAGINNQWGYRSYGKYTQLPSGSNVYARFNRLWKQDPETLEWSAWVMHPWYETISNIEYFPEVDAVISFGATYAKARNTKLCAYYLVQGEWIRLPRPRVQGRHSMMRYNATRGEVMLLGGDDSYRAAQILLPDGTLRDCADAPRNCRIKTDQLCYDPVSGHYLLMTYQPDSDRGVGSDDVEFFGYDPDTDEWYLISQWKRQANHVDSDPPPWPFSSKYAQPVVAAIPEMGVTIWIESTRSGVHLYKHKVP